ncbi:uncharacterized protein LOC132379047 [Hypanus sabinus]|uniref:uncharacterized protein LOC132379047 n=1 Tax=Hypanus sabinus TaxID=79690 RepID=UPI0028C3BBD9|nr:uncharacterized protein LOC132379047 [Hypanus sabinus]
MREDKKAYVFWLGDIADQMQETWEKCKKGVQAIFPRAVMPKSELHCTVIFDEIQNRELEKRWHLEACTQQHLEGEAVIIGKQGAALQVKWNTFLEKWYRIPEAAPHITLLVNKGCQSKDLGPLVKSAETITMWRKIMPEVWLSEDNNCIKIMVSVDMVGTVREVKITPQPHMPLLGKERGQQKDRRLDELPSILWSQHDTDVGKIKTASPVEIRLKRGAIPPRRPQYPLRPEAEEGIASTVQGLLEIGVLKRTNSPCNTPLLPVLKADKSKWRLVHDLRAVNDVVEDWPAVVPNPSTLLTNVPPGASYISVIDLCSAFFSIPLARGSATRSSGAACDSFISALRLPVALENKWLTAG